MAIAIVHDLEAARGLHELAAGLAHHPARELDDLEAGVLGPLAVVAVGVQA
jgi:hypothetical protein